MATTVPKVLKIKSLGAGGFVLNEGEQILIEGWIYLAVSSLRKRSKRVWRRFWVRLLWSPLDRQRTGLFPFANQKVGPRQPPDTRHQPPASRHQAPASSLQTPGTSLTRVCSARPHSSAHPAHPPARTPRQTAALDIANIMSLNCEGFRKFPKIDPATDAEQQILDRPKQYAVVVKIYGVKPEVVGFTDQGGRDRWLDAMRHLVNHQITDPEFYDQRLHTQFPSPIKRDPGAASRDPEQSVVGAADTGDPAAADPDDASAADPAAADPAAADPDGAAAAAAADPTASSADDTPAEPEPEVELVVWKKIAMPDGRIYYYNPATGETAWTLPDNAVLDS